MPYTRLVALILLLFFHSSVELTASTTEDNQGYASTLQNEFENMSSTLEAEGPKAAPAEGNAAKSSECPCEFCVSKSAAAVAMLLILSTCLLHVILIAKCAVSMWKICSSNDDAEVENYRHSVLGLGDGSFRNSRRNTTDSVILRRGLRNPSPMQQNSVFPDSCVSASSRVSPRQSFINLDNAVNKGKFAKTTEADSPSGGNSAQGSRDLPLRPSARTVPIIKVESPRGSSVEVFTDSEPGSASPEDSRSSVKSITPEALDNSTRRQSCKKPQENPTEEAETTDGDYDPSLYTSPVHKTETPSDAPFFRASSPSPLAIREPFSVASDSCIASGPAAFSNNTSQVPAYSMSAGLSTFPGFMNSTRASSNGNQRPNSSASLATQEPDQVSIPQPDLRGQYSTHSGQAGTHLQQEVQRSEFSSSSEVGAGVTLRNAAPGGASARSLRRCTSSGELGPAPCHPAASARRSFHHLSYFSGSETMV